MDGSDVELPESLSALVTERLRALPARVLETLVAVAALAAPSVTLLERMAPAVVDDIELAEKQGVIELDGDRIRFTHPLLAPASYAAMPLHRRRRLHRRLGELDIDLEERARHLAIAATGPDEEIAAALDAATAHARARGAVQAAAELAERAVALTPADAVKGVNRRRLTAAEHCRYAGDIKKAAVLLEGVVSSSQPGRTRAEALTQLAGVRGVKEGFPVAASLLSDALAEPGLEPGQEVNILCELAWMAHLGGDNDAGARYADDALALAEQLADPATLAIALAAVAQNRFARTGGIRRDLLDRALELEQTLDGDGSAATRWSTWTWHSGLPMRLSPSRVTLALLLGRSDRHDESRALWRELISEARERADPDVVRCLFHRAQTEMTSGAWDTAARLCDEAIQLTRQIGLETYELLCMSILAEIDAYRGETEKGAQRDARASPGRRGPPTQMGRLPPADCTSRFSSSPTTTLPRAGSRLRRFSARAENSTGTSPSWRARLASRLCWRPTTVSGQSSCSRRSIDAQRKVTRLSARSSCVIADSSLPNRASTSAPLLRSRRRLSRRSRRKE